MFGGCARESQRKRGARGECERPGGVRGVADGVQGNESKQEVARGEAGGGRGSVGARHASPLFVLLAEEEEDKGEEEVGWAGQVGRLQVSGPGRLLFFLFFSSVLFYLIYFATVLNLK